MVGLSVVTQSHEMIVPKGLSGRAVDTEDMRTCNYYGFPKLRVMGQNG